MWLGISIEDYIETLDAGQVIVTLGRSRRSIGTSGNFSNPCFHKGFTQPGQHCVIRFLG
jgi:hypothetical protein